MDPAQDPERMAALRVFSRTLWVLPPGCPQDNPFLKTFAVSPARRWS
jgi:hypothetical protein